MSERKTIVITGASAGIGAEFAKVCAGRGYDLVLVARREAPLKALSNELEATHGIRAHVITADLAARGLKEARHRGDVDDTAKAARLHVRQPQTQQFHRNAQHDPQHFLLGQRVRGGETGRLGETRIVDQTVNRDALVGDGLGQRLGSTIGGDTLYGPLKSFMIKFSQGLWVENQGTGVNVSVVCPGYTYSEFHDVNGSRAAVSAAYPKWMWLQADRVAREAWDAVEADRPRCIPGKRYKFLSVVSKLLPDKAGLKTAASHARKLKRV